MANLNPQTCLEKSFELTELAIQNGLIRCADSPEETAKDVSTFFKTLYEELSNAEIN
jgi:hypothetical protein